MNVLGTMHMGYHLEDHHPQIKADLESSELLAVEADEKVTREAIVEFQKYYDNFYGQQFKHFPELATKLKEKTWNNLRYTLEQDDVKRFIRNKGITHPSTEIHYSLALIVTQHFSDLGQNHVFHPDLLKKNTRYNELAIQDEASRVMDKDIEAFARKKGIPTMGLDNVGQVVAALHPKIRDYGQDQVESLYGGDNNLEKDYAYIQRMRKIYRSGDEAALSDFAANEAFDQDTLLNHRNKYWFDQLHQLEEKKIFVAVGVLHLVGKENLFNYFRDRNYIVERVELRQ